MDEVVVMDETVDWAGDEGGWDRVRRGEKKEAAMVQVPERGFCGEKGKEK